MNFICPAMAGFANYIAPLLVGAPDKKTQEDTKTTGFNINDDGIQYYYIQTINIALKKTFWSYCLNSYNLFADKHLDYIVFKDCVELIRCKKHIIEAKHIKVV